MDQDVDVAALRSRDHRVADPLSAPIDQARSHTDRSTRAIFDAALQVREEALQP
jgi:hypothetical protein